MLPTLRGIGILGVGSPVQIPAQDAEIGRAYLSRTGLRVIVKERTDEWVVVHSLATGHDVEISPSYPLTQDGRE